MNKNLLSWLLYDTGNSFPYVAFGSLYFSQWVIIDNGLDDIWYSIPFSAATFLVLITSPFWGAWSDRLKSRSPFISGFTLFMFLLVGLISLSMVVLPAGVKVAAALFIFFLLQYVYQLSLVFYNVLLESLSNKDTRGRISGLGQAFGDVGYMLATVALFPFAQGKITLLGEPGRSQVFLPTLVFCIIFCSPMLFLFKERRSNIDSKPIDGDLKLVIKKTILGIRELFRGSKNVAWFLLAFCFISDAVLTIQLFFAVILEKLFRVPDSQKLVLLLIMLIFNIPGDYLLGNVSDSLGAKRTLFLSTLLLVVVFSICFASSAPWVLYPVAMCAGIGWGGFYSASRALLVKISPPDRLGEYFGFYSTFQKFASILGPLVWGLAVLLFKDYGTINYRIAGFSMALLMVIGALLLRRVQETSPVVLK